jgi:hypothetical protein
MHSTQAGFDAQLQGKLTTKRYAAATIFVNHFSRLHHVHLLMSVSSLATSETKQAFE